MMPGFPGLAPHFFHDKKAALPTALRQGRKKGRGSPRRSEPHETFGWFTWMPSSLSCPHR